MKIKIYSVEHEGCWNASRVGYVPLSSDAAGVWAIEDCPTTLDAAVYDLSVLRLDKLPPDAQVGIIVN